MSNPLFRYSIQAERRVSQSMLRGAAECCVGSNVTFSHGSATARIPIFIVARFLIDGQPLVRAFRERHLPAL